MKQQACSDRFWFEHESGSVLYPCRIKSQQSGRALYRVGIGEGANRLENQRELDDIEQVYRLVFQKGWMVRMRADDGRNGMYAKDGRSIVRTSED